MPVVDLHTHILPERWPDWTQRSGYPGWVYLEHHGPGCARMMQTTGTAVGKPGPPKFFREIQSNCWDPKVRLQEMAACGVDVQVLSTVPVMFAHWARPGDALDLHRFLNDHLAGVCAAHKGRFYGLGVLPLQAPELACAELERCVRQLGLAGVQIGTHCNGLNLDAPELRPVLATAARLNASVFVHPWDMLGGDRLSKYWMPWLVGMPTETTIAIMSVLFGGVLDAFPTLRIGFAHGGGSFPGTLGRIEHGQQARPDLFPADASLVRAYLAQQGRPARFYVDALTHDAPALRALLPLFSPRRVAMGSDYPFPLGEDRPGSLIRSLPELSDADRASLLGGAALEFLGLPAMP